MKKIESKTQGAPDFEWPAWKSEKERIRFNSERYKDMDCSDAFEDFFGRKFKSVKDDSAYADVNIGDILELRILDVTKKGVIFDTGFLKENVVSSVNLYQYNRFKNSKFNKKEKVKCLVVKKDINTITVDPLAPLYNEWLDEKISNIKSQYNIKKDLSVNVSNLKLVQGAGYQGEIKIDNVSAFCGHDVYTRAFIPGSHIVLNIEKDFTKWEGKTVKAFISNLLDRDNSEKVSIICSAKDYLKFQGDKKKLEIFDKYCLDGEEWTNITNTVLEGVVTGVINSSRKRGVFVEIPEWNINGMIDMKSTELVKFHPGNKVKVRLQRIDEPTYFNDIIGQTQHYIPYYIENDILKKCNIKFVFEIVE